MLDQPVCLEFNQNLILSLRFHNRTNQRMKSWWPQLSLPVSVHPKKDSEYRYLRSMMISIFCSLSTPMKNLEVWKQSFLWENNSMAIDLRNFTYLLHRVIIASSFTLLFLSIVTWLECYFYNSSELDKLYA